MCTHHYLVDTTPDNGLTHAKCKLCGHEKDFPARIPDLWVIKIEPKLDPVEKAILEIQGKGVGCR